MSLQNLKYPAYTVAFTITESDPPGPEKTTQYMTLKRFTGRRTAEKYCRTMHTLSIRYQEGKEKEVKNE